jgi:hypothetical protein
VHGALAARERQENMMETVAHRLLALSRELRELTREIKELRDAARDTDDYLLATRAEMYMAAYAIATVAADNAVSASSYCDSAARVGDWRQA